MRRLVLAMALVAAAQAAHAADLPDLNDLPVLRGGLRDGLSSSAARWQGFYAGAQYGISTTQFGAPSVSGPLSSLATTTSSFASGSLSAIANPVKANVNGVGGFIGYNWQWDDVVLGIDANYSVGGQSGAAIVNPSTVTKTFVPGTSITTTTTGLESMKITDYGAVRARAGWAVGSFLPYVTGGLALGRADMFRSITVVGTIDPGGANTPYGPVTGTQAKNGAFIFGYSFGGGLDVKLTRGLFARGEVEVTRFTAAWGMDATVTTARGGLGYRF